LQQPRRGSPGARPARSITEEGAAAMAEVVKRAHLKELNMYMNDIGDGGALKARALLPKRQRRRAEGAALAVMVS